MNCALAHKLAEIQSEAAQILSKRFGAIWATHVCVKEAVFGQLVALIPLFPLFCNRSPHHQQAPGLATFYQAW